ncbi:hypothetical protein GJ629_13245 [Halapricum sp. CBA1109]|uniref:hypothetical protein n=1 Tax=Halapricum sp. CBA1109 TaxID=2668068 RepID=UPI0012F81A06|nr:hypothetical protein [Halapricum sp. CBA1109]MUV90746.1 hypothetical protein [Halapricum sp. CBA1109]
MVLPLPDERADQLDGDIRDSSLRAVLSGDSGPCLVVERQQDRPRERAVERELDTLLALGGQFRDQVAFARQFDLRRPDPRLRVECVRERRARLLRTVARPEVQLLQRVGVDDHVCPASRRTDRSHVPPVYIVTSILSS